LHNWASKNFAQQLKKLIGTCRSLSEEEIKEYDFQTDKHNRYREYVLDAKVTLPNGMVLQPGKFVIDGDKVVRGAMEMQNAEGKGIGIKFSECGGNDYPVFFTRPNKESRAAAIDWDHTGGNRMTAIRDAWVQRDSEEGLSKMETIIIGMMQEKNRRSAEEKTTTDTSRKEEREKIMDLLNL